jgi:hypothetical protein
VFHTFLLPFLNWVHCFMAKSKSKAAAAVSAPAPSAGLPLFFNNPQPVTPQQHATASFVDAGYGFARATNAIPVDITEFAEAVRCYPIVFTQGDTPMPMAIVGSEAENFAVNDAGEWAPSAYIPTYVRQYPFVFREHESGDCILCVDEGSPHFIADGSRGSRFFEGEDITDATKHALAFCGAFYRNTLTTRAMMADLVAYKLLVTREITMTLKDGHAMQLTGFQMVDEDALNALDDSTFAEFRKKGWLPFIYLSLASTTNWRRLMDDAYARRVAV